MERDYSAPTLASLLEDVSRSLGSQLAAERNPSLSDALLRLLAYTQTAQVLMDPSTAVNDRVRDMVDAEIEKIRGGSGVSVSTIFPGRRIDYSAFAPVGFYASDKTLGDYYRAKKWLGGVSFPLRSSDLPDARMAILLARTMDLLAANGDFHERYQSLTEPLAFLKGAQGSDLNWDMIAGSIRGYFGRIGMTSTAMLADDSDLRGLVEYTDAQFPSESSGNAPRNFRFMSQESDATGQMLAQLRKGTSDSYGMAVMASLGSDRASGLQSGGGDAVRAFLGAGSGRVSAESWVQDLDHAVLYTLRPLLVGELNGGYPRFMRGAAWRDRELGSALGGWAAFQHDVLTLPISQTATAAAMGRRSNGDLQSEGYVEPNPEAWARLASLAAYIRNGLTGSHGSLVKPAVADKLRDIESVSAELMRIAALELGNKDLSDAQDRLIATIGDRIAAYETFTDKSLQGKGATVVAGSAGNGVATGNPIAIYVIVPRNDGVGGLMLTKGAIYSYYETGSSDAAWLRTITTAGGSVAPDMNWMKSYVSTDRPFAQDAGKFQAVTASLSSVASATGSSGRNRSQSGVQLTLESNVVRRSVGELWLTVRAPQMDGTDIIMSVVNSAGQTVYQSNSARIENGERYDMIPVADLQSGQYFVRVTDILDHPLASSRFLVVR
jgi:hypothetical protein